MCREDGVYFMSKQIDFKNRDRFIQLGIAIAALRKMRGMSQEQLAEKSNVSRSHISAIEAPALLRNNDSVPSNFFYEDPSYEERCELLKAQYALLNVQYQRNKNDLLVSGHTDKINTFEEYNSEKPTLLQTLTAQFNWRNTENKKPFEVELIHQNILQKDLLEDNPIGTKENFDYNNYL